MFHVENLKIKLFSSSNASNHPEKTYLAEFSRTLNAIIHSAPELECVCWPMMMAVLQTRAERKKKKTQAREKKASTIACFADMKWTPCCISGHFDVALTLRNYGVREGVSRGATHNNMEKLTTYNLHQVDFLSTQTQIYPTHWILCWCVGYFSGFDINYPYTLCTLM